MSILGFNATVRMTAELQDLVEEGRFAKEFTFSHVSELMLFMEFVEEARARARLQYAHASNELQ